MNLTQGMSVTGKTLKHLGWSEGFNYMAMTSLADCLLDGVTTTYSIFPIPLEVNQTSTCNSGPKSKISQALHNTNLRICDDAPMASRFSI
jgi:PIF1-like helicase